MIADRIAAIILPLLGILGFIGLWWLVNIVTGWPSIILPSPLDVAKSLYHWWGLLMEHSEATLREVIIGYFLSIIVGISLAIVIVYFRTIERVLFPIMLGANAIPKVAIAPILVIWMGFGTEPKVAMVFLLCFFPIILSTAAGLKSTPAELTELVESMSATPHQSFIKVRFPYALPQIFVGLKVAISLAVIGAVVGEFVGAKIGLGYIIVISGSSADTSLAFASMVLLSVMAIILFYTLVFLEKWLLPWAEENK